MGIPIKDRGIRWAEAYGDKSAYLKEEFEKQVGPGSYFRWEGHDHTSGADYYAVVTPGYSEKHGYHFFAALRKMPAENGASGKKFKTQAEALSYAFETWKVTRPTTQPHKPYIDKDLEGKPIVIENVHAGLEPRIVKVANDKIVIDVSDPVADMIKEAMALMTGGTAGDKSSNPGPNDYPSMMRYAAAANLTMKPGSALHMSWARQIIDKYNQGPGRIFNPKTGERSDQLYPGVATCVPPSPKLWNQIMAESGVPITQSLLSTDKGQISIRPPLQAAVAQNHKIITFENNMVVKPTIKVGFTKNSAYAAFVQNFLSNPAMQSRLIPGLAPAQIDVKKPMEGKAVRRGNYLYSYTFPVDLFKAFREELQAKNIASAEPMSWNDENAVQVFSHLLANGSLNTPEGIEQAKKTPIAEQISLNRGQLITYDKRGKPIGLKVKRSQRFGQEAAADAERAGDPKSADNEDIKLEFRPGLIEDLLADRIPLPNGEKVGGNMARLHHMLSHNMIPFDRKMFVDASTCAPKNRNIHSWMPVTDEHGRPVKDADGKLKQERRSLIDPYTMHAPNGMVRMPNDKYGEILVPMPKDTFAQPVQTISGTPTIVEESYYYFPITDQHGNVSYHKISAGETKLYDPDSRGKFINGTIYTTYVKPEKSSSQKKDIKQFNRMEQDRNGIFTGYKRTHASMLYTERKRVLDQHIPQLQSLVMADDSELELPENWDAPENANNPAVLALRNKTPIKGYYYVGQRQYAPLGFTGATPTPDKPIIVPYMKHENGMLTEDKTKRPLEITTDDVAYNAKGVTYLTSSEKAMELVKAKLGFTDQEIGRYTKYYVEDLNAIDDKTREVDAKIASGVQLSKEEAVYAAFGKNDHKVPQAALEEFANVTDSPEHYGARDGTIFVIEHVQTGAVEGDSTFVSQKRAQEYMSWLEMPKPDGGGFPQGSLRITTKMGAMMPSIHTRGRQDHDLVANFVPQPDAPQQPQPVPPEAQQPQMQPTPEAQPQGELPFAEEPSFNAPAATPQEQVQEAPAPAQPAATTPEPVPAPAAAVQPQPVPQPKQPGMFDEWEQMFGKRAGALNRLVKLANMLDEQGKKDEADAVDRLIKMTLEKMKNE